MKKETIFLASDHAGFNLKEKIKTHLKQRKINFEDMGPHKYKKEDDYPDFIIPACEKVAKTKNSVGIIIGGSGQGEAMAANKVKGIRATAIYSFNKDIVTLSKKHNDANVLSLGARFLSEKEAMRIIDLWTNTSFSGESRHIRRIRKINSYEDKK